MSILFIVLIAVVLIAAVCFSTLRSLRSDNLQDLPKEIADELDPYNKAAN